jgi:DNA anti-recombination protein RmuC
MDLELLESLTEYGVLGLWTVSLLWRDVSLTRRLNEQQTKFQEQLDRLESKSEEREDALRERYDQVIADFTAQREKMLSEVIARLERIEEVARKSAEGITAGLQQMAERYAEERALQRIRDQQR